MSRLTISGLFGAAFSVIGFGSVAGLFKQWPLVARSIPKFVMFDRERGGGTNSQKLEDALDDHPSPESFGRLASSTLPARGCVCSSRSGQRT
jgi:hypothetical protein